MNKHFPDRFRHRSAASPDIVVGLGARAGAQCTEILGLIDTVLAAHALDRSDIAACVTLAAKGDHPALREASAILGVPLLTREAADLDLPVPTPSVLVMSRLGIPSVAEAAALSFGPLVVAKQRSANATCALSRIVPAQLSSAAIAATMVATSSAGP